MDIQTGLNYHGKVVLITGGAKGVGAGISRSFLAAGAQVVVCGRSAPEQLPQVDGRSAHFIAVDVREVASLQRLFAQVLDDFGRLDVLINNAGGSPPAEAASVSPRFSESIIRLNLIAPLNVAQQANAIMQEQAEGGVILFIGSISALRPSPLTAVYGAAKAGILSLASSLAVEWAPKVRVVTVSPGLVRTEQSHQHYGDGQASPPSPPPFRPGAWPTPRTSVRPVSTSPRRWPAMPVAATCCCMAAVSALRSWLPPTPESRAALVPSDDATGVWPFDHAGQLVAPFAARVMNSAAGRRTA